MARLREGDANPVGLLPMEAGRVDFAPRPELPARFAD